MGDIARDLKYALRMLAKSPGFTLVAVLVLALGIGANSAIFSVVNAVLMRPLPYAEPERLVKICSVDLGGSSDHYSVSPANFLDYREQCSSFEALAAYRHTAFNLTGGDRPERLDGAEATANFFDVLGARPALGRAFQPTDDGREGRVAVLSDRLWRSRFAASPAVVGQTLTLDGDAVTIVGVMPASFRDMDLNDMWVSTRRGVPSYPLAPNADPTTMRGNQYMDAVGRLKPGVTLAQAREELRAVAERLAVAYPDSDMGVGATAYSLREEMVGDARQGLFVLFGAVGFVLLIACANVANLLIARAAGRRKEIAIRTAIGATRSRVVRQLLVESLLLSLAGGVVGALFAMWGIGPLAALATSGNAPAESVAVDGTVLLFTLAVSVVTGLLFGIAPALRASRVDVNDVLKGAERGTSGGFANDRARSVLVVTEVALSLVLLVGAGLMVRSFLALRDTQPGFEPHGLVVAQVSLPGSKYGEKARQTAFYQSVLDDLRASPGVRSASAVSRIPFTGGNSSRSLILEGRAPDDQPDVDYRVAAPDYFKTMGVAVLAGREFVREDTAESTPVAVVNSAFAKAYFAGADPIGKHVRSDPEGPAYEIVGVVGDMRHASLERAPKPEFYLNFDQEPWPFMAVVARTDGDTTALAGAIRGAVWSVDKDQPLANVSTMDDMIAKSSNHRRFNTQLLGAFAAAALLLAGLGLYGVMAFTVTQRVREIGIRVALGATPGNIARLVVGQAAALVAVGIALGTFAALALARFMESMLFGVSATDPTTYALVAAGLAAVGALAAYVPTRRATRVDPMVALRYD